MSTKKCDESGMSYAGSDGLLTLQREDQNRTEVPETRMKDALSCQNYFRRLIDCDQRRSAKRAKVNGLVDGNSPYSPAALRKAGRADAANVNWGRAKAYLEAASGSFYDLFSESPGYLEVRTAFGSPEQREQWSSIISSEADRVLRESQTWDYEMSLSIDNLVLHGCGPLLFENAFKPLPKAFACGALKVPEFSKSDTFYWDSCGIEDTLFPPELFKYIENADAAEAVGWNIEHTRLVISEAMGIRNQAGRLHEWEFYQSELKNNSLSYYDEPKVCRLAHVFWKEFDGRVTHAIVERDTSTGLATEYLYHRVGRYRNWNEVIHPMYFDHGNGGYHHSVTGLGVKMYGAMEYENRLICNLCDKAFAPKVLFKPTTSEARQGFELTMYGEFGVLPKGMDSVQSPVAGLLDDGLGLHELLKNTVTSTLGGYQQTAPTPKPGNPDTRWEAQYKASILSALNKTQFNRYYRQLDTLYAEVYRRLSNPNTQDETAMEFQERCHREGVPQEALQRTERVQATRVVGQGSAFMRKSALDAIFVLAGALPEDGRDHLIADKIAAEAGQSAVARYFPRAKEPMASDQVSEATQWVAAIKVGVPPVVASSQNPTTYAATFLAAATTAVQGLQQGADPAEVLRFLEIAGPAIAAHLKRLAQDPTRQEVFKAMSEQWQQLAAITDKLKGVVAKLGKQMRDQQDKTKGAMTDEALKMTKVAADIKAKEVKTQAQLKQSAEKHQLKVAQATQDLVLQDASTAAEIRRQQLKAEAEAQATREKAAASGNGDSGESSQPNPSRFRIIRR